MQAHEQSIFGTLVEKLFHVHLPDYLVMSTVIVIGWTALLLLLRPRLREDDPGTLQVVLEGIVKFLRGTLTDVIGSHGTRFVPLIGLFFVFIITANLCGLVPWLQPPTDSYTVTLSLALMSFVYYNAVGIRAQGIGKYLRHFAAPPMGAWAATLLLSLLLVPVEIISHSARVLSLSVRLFGNIFGEHLASGVFRGLVPLHVDSPGLLAIEIPAALIAPMPVMLLGLIGSVLQAFIFVMLSTIYLAMATEHEHEEGGHGEDTSHH